MIPGLLVDTQLVIKARVGFGTNYPCTKRISNGAPDILRRNMQHFHQELFLEILVMLTVLLLL